jgi:hypothetical protein
MAMTLCVPPREGELCAPVRFDLTSRSTFLELTARHRITNVECDDVNDTVVVCVDITDPEISRPIHVRFDLVEPGTQQGSRSFVLGDVVHNGDRVDVVGTYLGVVSEEN